MCRREDAEKFCRTCREQGLDHPLCHAACLFLYFSARVEEYVEIDLEKIARETNLDVTAVSSMLGRVVACRKARGVVVLMRVCAKMLEEWANLLRC
ncbi:MAG: hypothetical protein QXF04_00530 [Candidatus Aenigmatarchaeota archaeon]